MAETTEKKRNYTRKKTEPVEPMANESEAKVEEKEEKRTFTEDEMQALIAKAVAEALEKAKAEQTVKISMPEDMVTVLFIAEVSPESELLIPGYGSMRPMSYMEVPKKEFGNKFMSSLVRRLIDDRSLIVTSGLSADERRRWNCDYKEGEVMDEQIFDHMLDYETPKLASIFERLCPEHQRFVACRMITAKEKGDNRISVEKARKINDLSKVNDPNGMLKPVMEAFGAEIKG